MMNDEFKNIKTIPYLFIIHRSAFIVQEWSIVHGPSSIYGTDRTNSIDAIESWRWLSVQVKSSRLDAGAASSDSGG
jgi:hypothetical protein